MMMGLKRPKGEKSKREMQMDLDYVRTIKDAYRQKYVRQEPYSQYVTGCGISLLEVLVELCGDNIVLQEGESLDDYCLKVDLSQQPPQDVKLPSFYCGVRVHYGVSKR